ncbi:CBS domain-containing protein [Halobacterium wangiae]|uniref:CBS domain-containing protein n=1 Tax=Halobacterium wangiae TaxID=2902623 RepID=UPI001E4D012D|nr:CBS domain-containing protein [Halobacterium wangiae]
MPQLPLRDVMSHEFVGVSESDPLLDAVELMRAENTTSAVVLRGNQPVGLVTTEGVLDLLLDDARFADTTVSDVMRETPEMLPPDAVVSDAANAMGRTGDPRVLVTDGNGVRGIVEARDIAPTVTGPAREQSPEAVSAGASQHSGSEFGDGSSRDDFTGTQTDYAEQGVCESCGGLTGELVSVNGQLLCIECRSV